jgi:hypothetical protein
MLSRNCNREHPECATVSSYYQSPQKGLEDQTEQQEKLEKAYTKVSQNLTGNSSTDMERK